MGDLYWGDNLEIMRAYIPNESVDLVYLDPPFNSNRNHNVLFKENGRAESDAQIEALTDTWHWTQQAEPSAPMNLEAVEAGFYWSERMQRDYPRIQILTIADLFDERSPQMPPRVSPYQLASRQKSDSQQRGLFDERAGGD